MKTIIGSIFLLIIFSSCVKHNDIKSNTDIIYRDIALNKIDTIDLNTFTRTYPIDTIIPDKITAVKYAFLILSNVYGEKEIRGEFPLNISLEHSNWIITGSLPDGFIGGTAYININMKTGGVNKIIHFK